MGIKANFTKDDVKKRFDAILDEVGLMQIDTLKELGEACLAEARKNGDYKDRTGNLRSSVGYEVFVDGVAVHSNFPQVSVPAGVIRETRTRKDKQGNMVSYQANVRVGGDGIAGVRTGQSIAEQIGKETKGVALVVVAGMNYATYVEARGYNVLSSAKHLAERELPRMLEQIKNGIKRFAD